jgi:hypothetical protein
LAAQNATYLSKPPMTYGSMGLILQGYTPSSLLVTPLLLENYNKTSALNVFEQLYTARGSQGIASYYRTPELTFDIVNPGEDWNQTLYFLATYKPKYSATSMIRMMWYYKDKSYFNIKGSTSDAFISIPMYNTYMNISSTDELDLYGLYIKWRDNSTEDQ